MIDQIIITKETIENANDFMPLEQKTAFAEMVAQKCRVAVQIGADDGVQTRALPPMFAENIALKARYFTGALVKYYLGFDFDGVDGDPYLLSTDDYNALAGCHLFTQIEVLEVNRVELPKCLSILADYRALESMANTELQGALQVQNDPVTRLLAFAQAAATPEYMNALAQDLAQAKDELAAYSKARTDGAVSDDPAGGTVEH